MLEAALSGQALYYHRVGTPQSEDRLIYERKDLPTLVRQRSATEDGRYLLVFMSKGSDNNNRLYYADLGDPRKPNIGAPVKPLVEDDDAEFNAFGNEGSMLYLRTDRGAPNRKVIALDIAHPAPAAWKTIVPEASEAIESVRPGRRPHRRAVPRGRAEPPVALRPRRHRCKATSRCRASAPWSRLGGREDAPEIFYSFSSPLFPTTVFAYDPASKAADAVRGAEGADRCRASSRPGRCSPRRRTARACRSS